MFINNSWNIETQEEIISSAFPPSEDDLQMVGFPWISLLSILDDDGGDDDDE